MYRSLRSGVGLICMLLLNFAHLFTSSHVQQIEASSSQKADCTFLIPARIDPELYPRPLSWLSSEMWQKTVSILVNSHALDFIAIAFLAELHGCCWLSKSVFQKKSWNLRTVPNGKTLEHDSHFESDLACFRESLYTQKNLMPGEGVNFM